jgi:hypothetical protein
VYDNSGIIVQIENCSLVGEFHYQRFIRISLSPIIENKMKVSNLIGVTNTVITILPQQSTALRCGIKLVTEPCIGDRRPLARYNPDASYDLKRSQ